MEHFEVAKKLETIVTNNKEFFTILTEQITNEVIQFCEENDIERNTPEFMEIMNHMGIDLLNGVMLEWEMSKLKAVSKPPMNPGIDAFDI